MRDAGGVWPPEPDGAAPSPVWARAAAAAALLSVDPVGLGGLWLRARVGPVRERLTYALAPPLPRRRVHPGVADDALFGGVDLTAALAEGRLSLRAGLLDASAALVLPMAERASAGLAARLARALDEGGADHGGFCLIALDEGAEPDETLAPALADRLALHLDLTGLAWSDTTPLAPLDAAAARERLPAVTAPDEALADLTRVAARLGVWSLRAPTLALRVALASAALAGRDETAEEDLRLAVELTLAPRATIMPEAPEDAPEPEPPQEDEPQEDQTDTDDAEPTAEDEIRIPEEVLLEAAKAMLPPDLLARIAAGRAARARQSASSGAGARRRGASRGRPLPSRPGRLGGPDRIDVIATLRAAAPWQTLRAKAPGQRLAFRPNDIRVRRFQEQTERLLIFVVDASGSAAFARLGEAKGAVELLLAEAYARRDQVALIAFRGDGAELLLPPTRSLVQTKRRLAGLPGGGGTPLAAGLKAALALALTEQGKGLTPAIALLTDGRANIALDGEANRPRAAEDASAMAKAIRAKGVAALVIDMGARPERSLSTLAGVLDAPYIPLPRADAARLSAAIDAGLA